jgi:hypothetical protein
MKARSYLNNIKPKYKHGNDWFQVKPGTAAVAVAETTPTEVMQFAGEIHDMSVMDPADLLERFEEYEDPEFDGEDWGIL